MLQQPCDASATLLLVRSCISGACKLGCIALSCMCCQEVRFCPWAQSKEFLQAPGISEAGKQPVTTHLLSLVIDKNTIAMWTSQSCLKSCSWNTQVIPQGHIVREGRLDYHSFALVFSDSTVKALPPSTSLTGPIYFWKHLKEQGDCFHTEVKLGAF